jgi:hypothetical protein
MSYFDLSAQQPRRTLSGRTDSPAELGRTGGRPSPPWARRSISPPWQLSWGRPCSARAASTRRSVTASRVRSSVQATTCTTRCRGGGYAPRSSRRVRPGWCSGACPPSGRFRHRRRVLDDVALAWLDLSRTLGDAGDREARAAAGRRSAGSSSLRQAVRNQRPLPTSWPGGSIGTTAIDLIWRTRENHRSRP